MYDIVLCTFNLLIKQILWQQQAIFSGNKNMLKLEIQQCTFIMKIQNCTLVFPIN